MPLYDYICERCGTEFEEFRSIDERAGATCSRCGQRAKQILKRGHGGLSLFQPGWWRDIDYYPVYVDSPQQLRRELDAREASAPYLEDGLWKTSPEASKQELKHERQGKSDR